MLGQIRRRAPRALHRTAWFWGVWLVIGIIVELGAAYGWGRKTEGDTLSELWWTIVTKVAGGQRPATGLGRTVGYGLSIGAGVFLAWASVHLATGLV